MFWNLPLTAYSYSNVDVPFACQQCIATKHLTCQAKLASGDHRMMDGSDEDGPTAIASNTVWLFISPTSDVLKHSMHRRCLNLNMAAASCPEKQTSSVMNQSFLSSINEVKKKDETVNRETNDPAGCCQSQLSTEDE